MLLLSLRATDAANDSFLVCDDPHNNADLQRNGSIVTAIASELAWRGVNETCFLRRHPPSVTIFILYSFVVPALAAFGFCANFINGIVFMRPKMTPSAFTYLSALSALDCCSCLLIILAAMSRSFFYYNPLWIKYDFQWHTPLFGITTGAANLILACVSLDRLIYLTRCMKASSAPRFCRRKVARTMIGIVLCISVVANTPYFFVFVVNPDGTCRVTDFYYTDFYKVINWLTFSLLAVLPAIFLLVGNIAIIIVFRRWSKRTKCCHERTSRKRYQHQVKLTITIVIVITLYMLGELPAHVTSRKCALNLIYNGNVNKINFDTLETLEVVCIMLNALQLSTNIVVYAVINPLFMPEFFDCLRSASDTCLRYLCFVALARSCCCCSSCCGQAMRATNDENCQQPADSPTADCPVPNTNNTTLSAAAAAAAATVTVEAACGCSNWSTDSECSDHGKTDAPQTKSLDVFATYASAKFYVTRTYSASNEAIVEDGDDDDEATPSELAEKLQSTDVRNSFNYLCV